MKEMKPKKPPIEYPQGEYAQDCFNREFNEYLDELHPDEDDYFNGVYDE